MAIIDVVKYEVNERELVYKFPSDDLRIGTQLIVYTGQTAFFVKDGIICDQFEAGSYTINTQNIPLLSKLLNLPFGGDTPFKAEVWFVNKLVVLDSKWGTPSPIQLEDPKYDIIVPVRAYGQYGIKVGDPKKLIETLVGNMPVFSRDRVNSYFKGKVMSVIANLISDKLTKDKISILNINSHLNVLSEFVFDNVKADFEKYGIELVNFYFLSVNVPQDDPSFLKLKEAKDLAARLKITGKDVYQMERSFDVLDIAAANEAGGGNMLNMGVGLGAGINVGNQVGNIAAQNLSTNSVPPIPQMNSFYVAINGTQQGPYDLVSLKELISQGKINSNTLVWKQGLPIWIAIASIPELASLFNCPPPIPSM